MQKLTPIPKTNLELACLHTEDFNEKTLFEIKEFCRQAQEETKFQAQNWSISDWEKKPETLLNCIFVQRRFDSNKGLFTFVRDESGILACGGVYKIADQSDIMILGTRAFTLPGKRGTKSFNSNRFLHGEYLFPAQEEWAIKNQAKCLLLTFNEHNVWLKDFVIRIAHAKPIGLGINVSQNAKRFYQGFQEYREPMFIQNTRQMILYKNLDPDFSVLKFQQYHVNDMII